PLIAISVLGVCLWLRLPARPTGGRVDVGGLVAISAASTGIVLAVTWGGHEYAWLSAPVLVAAGVALVSLVALVLVERRAAHPVLPLDLFRNRAVASSFVVLFLAMGAVMMAALNFVPLFLQLVQGRSASSSGLLLLPMLLPALAIAFATGAWTSKGARFRPVMIAGTGVLAIACVLMATVGNGPSAWATAACMVAIGTGIGLLFQTPIVLVQNSAPAREVGAATGVGAFMRTIGGAIGVGALGALFASTFASSLGATELPAGTDAASLTPQGLASLAPAAHTAVVGAVSDATGALFWGAAVAAVLALVAALAVPRQRA
ncbi:MAG TPA: MFS transporter, partial [Cellulomonas sp.]|nr:MFS transporter [Cellulomonas sp.]